MKIFKGLSFLSVDLLFVCRPHLQMHCLPCFCFFFKIFSLFVFLQFESAAGSAGGLCFISSEVYWPAESLLFPANVWKSKVFFALCSKSFNVKQETKSPRNFKIQLIFYKCKRTLRFFSTLVWGSLIVNNQQVQYIQISISSAAKGGIQK